MASRFRQSVAAVAIAALALQPVAGYGQVVPDGRAAAGTRPLVESTANGLPLVQITAPSAAGVSRNQYLQYNVDRQGLVLNNAVTITKTQQAGFIDGNPFLGKGAARLILNEVTGGDLSRLRGFTEVAGQRAEVVIANPNGITCDGCGFINASRGVLTTGTPVFDAGGALAALQVTRGLIRVDGQGLHGNDAERVDLVSRAASINADLWANQLNIVAGANRVAYEGLATQRIAGEGVAPAVSIDVAELGGMYADRIRLVGTEAGVGVNSRGTIAALQGDFTVTTDGKVVLAGTTSVAGSTNIEAAQAFANSGVFYGEGDVRIATAGAVENSGSLSTGGSLSAVGATLAQKGAMAAGVDAGGILGAAGDLSLSAEGRVDVTGTTAAAGAVALEGSAIDAGGAQVIAGSASIHARAGDVDATAATMDVAGALAVSASGTVRHDQAVTVAGAVDVDAAGLSNRGGTLGHAGGSSMSVRVRGRLDNTDGVIATNAADAAISAQALVNDRGLIEHAGSGALALQSEQAIDNEAGLIASNGDVRIDAAALSNAGGALSAAGNVSVTVSGGLDNAGGEVRAARALRVAADGGIDNRDGTLQAEAAADVRAASLDNRQGRLTAVGSESLAVAVAQALDNSAGLLGGNGDTTVTAGTLANRGGELIAGANLAVRSDAGLDNAGGRISAGGAVALQQSGALNNDGGEIQAGGGLQLAAGSLSNVAGRVEASDDAELTAGAVANAGGAIAANRDVEMSASSLAGAGKVTGGRDVDVAIAGDYTHLAGSEFASGRDLRLDVGGRLVNEGDLAAPSRVAISSGALVNESSGRIAGAAALVEADGSLVNRGRIEGDDVTVGAAAVQNAASIVGDRVTLGATSVANEGGAALIGATERLALHVTGELANRDGANLYSLGDMTISGGPDRGADGRFLAPTSLLLNESAYIEADGDLEIAAVEIVNRRASLSTGTETIGASAQWFVVYPGWPVIQEGYDNENNLTFYTTTYVRAPVTETVQADAVIEHDEANRRLTFSGTGQEVVTEYVCEGSSDGDFCGNRSRIAEVPKTVTAYYESVSRDGDTYTVFYYPEYDPNVHIHPSEQFAVFIDGRGHTETRRYVENVVTEERVVASAPEPRIAAGGAMALDVRGGLRNEFGLVVAGSALAVDAGKVANVGRDLLRTTTQNRTSTVEWHDSCDLGENDCGDSVVAWPLPPAVTTAVAGTVRGVVAANQSLTIAARSVDNVSVTAAGAPVGSIAATSVLPSTVPVPGARTVDPLGTGFALPTGGLFRVAPPNPDYLIETDPRFADYGNFLSSDYMLSRLALDPATTTKRLGDGFYEARLIRDEVYQLTGRRYLAAYASDTEQFQALMENGIAFAAAMNLSPGIALTAEQMVALTHDIVWLEEREVTVPGGGTERVLVPVVYLAATDPEDIAPSGALIAANDLELRTTDALANSGMIRGGDRAAITADTVRNVGGTITSRGATQVEAAGDLLNRSGEISGRDVSVLAGRDLRIETATQTVTAGSAALGAGSTLMSRRGSIAADRDVIVAAGRDVVVSGAEVRAGGDAAIGAAGSVRLETVESRESRQLYMGRSHSVTEKTTQIGSTVSGGGAVSIGAQDSIALRAADVDAGGDLILEAGGAITVGEARDTALYDAESRGRKGTFDIRRSYDETVVGSSLTAGGGVAMTAGASTATAASSSAAASGDITITGSSVRSGSGDVAIVTPGSVTVEAASERHTRFAHSLSKSGGALAKKQVEELQSSDTTLARGSTVSGENVAVVSGDSVTVRGSSVVATDDVAISAQRGVTITTAEQTLATENYRHEKKSGVFSSGGFGLTVGKQSIKSRETEDTLTNLGSTVGSVQGRATIVAGEDYRQTGSEVLAPGGIDIAAGSVTIDAAQDTTRTTYSYEAKQGGLSVGLSGGVVSPLVTAKDSFDRGQEVEDSRLKAVYAYRAGRTVYEAGKQAAAAAAGTQPLFQIQIGIGSSEQKLDSHSESTRAVGSRVSSAGDVSIAAAGGASGGGDLSVTGSSVSGRNVALSAANELSLRAAANTSATQTVESGKSGAVGVGLGVGGGGAGISAFASASRMKGNTSGSGTTWTETQVTVAETLSLASGGDAALVGAQARGERIEAQIGGDLALQSQQDLDTYRRDVRQSGGSVGYTFGAGGFSGSASSARTRIDSDFASVQEQTGLFAGSGGFDVDVRGNTDLQGAVIASEATPDKNRLASDTLTFGNIDNRAEYEASSAGGAIGFGGTSLPIPTPVLGVSGGEDAASTTLAAVAPGTLEIRNPANQRQDVSALSRAPDASHQALARIFDPNSVEEQQELAQVFGQEAFRAVGDIAAIFTRPYEQAKADEAIAREYLALKAKDELTEAERNRLAIYEQEWKLTPQHAELLAEDALRRQELAQADYDAWKDGSLNKTLLHGFVGALQASLGGADPLSGALGAGAAEASRSLTEDLPKELQQWASAAVGAAAGAMASGGGAGLQTGAATAWSGEVYNRQLHITEHQLIRNKTREIAQESPPEHRAEVEQYWYLLMVSEAQAMVDAKFATQREADLSYLAVLAADPTREADFYFDNYVADRAQARQLLLSMQGQTIVDTSGQPIAAHGGALVTFSATNDRQYQDHSLFAPGTPPWQQWQQFRDGPSVPELSGYVDSQIANAGANRSVELAAQSRSERYATPSGAVDSTFPELDLLLAGGLKALTEGLSVAKRINDAILAMGKGPLNPEIVAKDATILGENMAERVIPFAEKTGARTLPFSTTADEWARMTPQQRWRLNDGTLRARINEGNSFRYIGQDPFRPPAIRMEFDLTRSELLRLQDRNIPYEVVSPSEVKSVLGRP